MRVEPDGLRFRHFYCNKTGRLVGTICTMLDVMNPTNVYISASICSPKDNPSKKRGRDIALARMTQGKTRYMWRELLKEEITARTILDWFDCGSQDFTLKPPNKATNA